MTHTLSLRRNYEFRRVYARGKNAAAPHLVLYVRKNGSGANRLGITVGSKVGKAVVRNRVRRRLKEIYRLHESQLRRGVDLVVVARVRAANADYATLERDFLRLAGQLGLLGGEEK